MRYIPKKERQQEIILAALKVASRDGLHNIVTEHVAREAECSSALVRSYFKGTELLDAVMAEAVKRGDLSVIVQGLWAKHPVAQAAPVAVREEALLWLLNI